jgi:hypothetical protein
VAVLVYFPVLVCLYQEKSGNPVPNKYRDSTFCHGNLRRNANFALFFVLELHQKQQLLRFCFEAAGHNFFSSRIKIASIRKHLLPKKISGLYQDCQIFLGAIYQTKQNNHIIYQMATKCTKWPQNILKGHKIQQNGNKIQQMAGKCTNIFHCKSLQNLPKLCFWFEHMPSGNPGLY